VKMAARRRVARDTVRSTSVQLYRGVSGARLTVHVPMALSQFVRFLVRSYLKTVAAFFL
jgi:hypothetical protein